MSLRVEIFLAWAVAFLDASGLMNRTEAAAYAVRHSIGGRAMDDVRHLLSGSRKERAGRSPALSG